MSKKRWGREAWDVACHLVAADDGLPVVETNGMWTAHKLFFLCSYLVQVVEGMFGNKAFPDGLTFVDCFAGTGVCVVRDQDGASHRYPGSSLIAASLTRGAKRLSRILSVEEDRAHAAALRSRVAKAGFEGEFHCWEGDFNKVVSEVANEIPMRSLNVAFVDPYSLNVHFESISWLARTRSLDLVILFSDRIDLQRNVESVYYPGASSKLDEFLGRDSNWRADFDALDDRGGGRLRELFAQVYLRQLSKLRYQHAASWPLEGPQGPMFRLVFASKHPLGIKYADIARKEDFGGEQNLFG